MIIDETNYSIKGKQLKDIANRITANHDAIGDIGGELASKQDALSQTQLDAVNSGIDSTKVGQIATNTTNIGTNTGDIATINGKIPAQASSSNQLADKDFVNSSIATNTANFIGTFNSVAELEAYSGPVTNNDYAFVIVTDAQGNTAYDRYKYNGSTSTWLFEYELNNSSFTADQWASINSGITSGDVTKLAGITAGAEPNTIDSISVNGTAVTPDANKNVALTIPDGIKTLTTAEYNYPSDNPTAVAIWKLEKGIYLKPAGILARRYAGSSSSSLMTTDNDVIIVAGGATYSSGNKRYAEYIAFGDRTSAPDYRVVDYNSGSNQSPTGFTYNNTGQLLTSDRVMNHLSTTSEGYILDARQGKVLKDLIDSLVIKNAGAPTTSTVGTVGMLLEDTTNGKLYQCTAIDNTDPQNIVYTWTEVGGGSGPTVVQTTGTSTTDVMSQNAATKMIFPTGSSNSLKVSIGDGSSVTATSGIAIGQGTASANRGIAIGFSDSGSSTTVASGANSVALGGRSTASGLYSIAMPASSATSQGVMSIGIDYASFAGNGYNNSNYRLLTGLYDPQSAHDAATKGYTDTKATITMTTTDPGEGAPIDANELIGYYS